MKKNLKTAVYAVCYALRSILNLAFNFREVSILCYHSISESNHDTAVSVTEFEKQLEVLRNAGYVFVSLGDIVLWHAGKRALPRKAVAVTFDDGYADFETAALPVLQKFQAPAALFVIGEPHNTGWRVDEEPPFLSRDALEKLRTQPLVELGYHSKTHPNLATLGGAALEAEVAPPFPARYFAYPGGNHSKQAAAALKEARYEAAFTIRPVTVMPSQDAYFLPRSVVTKSMSQRDVLMHVTRAANWYRALADLV